MVMDAFTMSLTSGSRLTCRFPSGHLAFPGAFEVAIGGLSGSVMLLGLPSFRLEAEAGSWIVGDGEPAVVVRGLSADLYRSLTGRRLSADRATHLERRPGTMASGVSLGPVPAARQIRGVRRRQCAIHRLSGNGNTLYQKRWRTAVSAARMPAEQPAA